MTAQRIAYTAYAHISHKRWTITYIKDWKRQELTDELLHFQEVASLILPRKGRFPPFPTFNRPAGH